MQQKIYFLDKVISATLFIFVIFSMFSISITQISAGLGGLAWLCRMQLTRTWADQSWSLGIPFALFALACLIAVVGAYDPSYSYESLKKLLEILVFFWVINCARKKHLRDSLIILLIISATFAGAYGIYQTWNTGVSIVVPDSRVEGTMSVYMTFAGLLMMVGTFSISRIFFKRPVELWLLPAIGIVSICLLFTLTRQAWLGISVGIIFMLSILQKKILFIFPIILIFLVIIFTDSVRLEIQKLSPPKDDSFSESLKFRVLRTLDGKDENFHIRIFLWQGGWEVFKDYPLSGCGFRCMDLVFSQYPDPSGNIEKLRGMHNNLIQLAVDTGVLGLTTWISIWFFFFRLLYKKTKSLDDDSNDHWIIFGSAATVIAFLMGGFFETNFYDSEVTMLLYFIMALPFSGSEQPLPLKHSTS